MLTEHIIRLAPSCLSATEPEGSSAVQRWEQSDGHR